MLSNQQRGVESPLGPSSVPLLAPHLRDESRYTVEREQPKLAQYDKTLDYIEAALAWLDEEDDERLGLDLPKYDGAEEIDNE